MNIDLHVHSRLSKAFDYDAENMPRIVPMARRRGLEALALTEHIHAVGFWTMHSSLRGTYPYSCGAYDVDGFTVLSGAEITARERVDFIVIGPADALRVLDGSFRPRLSESNFVPALDLVGAARSLGLVTVLAHPFRDGKEAMKLDPRTYASIDAIEFNGRDFGTKGRTRDLARWHRLPLTGGSDAHHFMQVGIGSTVTCDPIMSFADLRQALADGTAVESKPYAPSMVALCKAIKRAAKAHAVERGLTQNAMTRSCNLALRSVD